MRKLLSILLAAVLFVTPAVPAQAATAKEAKAIQSYNTWMKNNYKSYRYYDIVDIDENGIPELLVNDFSEYRIFTYDYGKKQRVLLKRADAGRAGSLWGAGAVTYNSKRKYFSYVVADTGGNVQYFYSLKGKTIKKISTYQYKAGRLMADRKDRYYKNGKSISEASYTKKLNAAVKGYKKLRYQG